nr:cytochrome d ubiquinol oxidase subunit II [Staphylococcus lugdunensis]
DTHVYLTVRKWLLLWSIPMIMVSLFVFLSLRIQNANHFTNAIYNYWWMFTLSLLCFIIAMSLALLKKYHGIAMLMMILQLFFAFFGYGLSKLPYIVYPFVKITDTTVSVATGLTLMIVIILGLLLLIPSLILLLRLATDNKGIVKNQK